MARAQRDAQGRLLLGSVIGWGMSWWWREQGLDPAATSALTREQLMENVLRYWHAVGQGWSPHVPEEQRIGPHHPFDSSDH